MLETAAAPQPHRSRTAAAPQPHRSRTAAALQPHRTAATIKIMLETAAAPQPQNLCRNRPQTARAALWYVHCSIDHLLFSIDIFWITRIMHYICFTHDSA